jgi:carbamoyl-phosphate synthase large subunit
MRVVDRRGDLAAEVSRALDAGPSRLVLIDRFLEGAVEIDVDAVHDGTETLIGGILEHIEEAGVHSGDSACVLPTVTLSADQEARIAEATDAIARALGVVGLLNVQFALKDEELHCLEANPRASRTVPFVSKATGVALAKVAARVMAGTSLAQLRDAGLVPARASAAPAPQTLARPGHVAVKEAVLPFARFPGTDPILGPEMRSTGEVMGIARTFADAFARSQAAAGAPLPSDGGVFVSVADRDKRAIVLPARRLADLGFVIHATAGTAAVLERAGVRVRSLGKVSDGDDRLVSLLAVGGVRLVLNTPYGSDARTDGALIRRAAIEHGVPCITTLAGISAAVQAIDAGHGAGAIEVRTLQEHLAGAATSGARPPMGRA